MSEVKSAHQTTLEELLRDEKFVSQEHEQGSKGGTGRYQNCLNDFLKGDHKKCLEHMLESGLSTEELNTNSEVWKLFISACREADFKVLGISVVKLAKAAFASSDISQVEKVLATEPLHERMAGVLMFLECNLKVCKLDGAGSLMSAKLEQVTKNLILADCRVVDTLPEATQLRDLVLFYIFGVQAHNAPKRAPKSQYVALCEYVPELPKVLSNFAAEADHHTTLESEVRAKLGAVSEKTKAKQQQSLQHTSSRKSRSLPHDSTIERQKPGPAAAPSSNTIVADRKDASIHTAPMSLLARLQISVTKLWPQQLHKNFAPVAVLAIFLILKKTQRLRLLTKKLPTLFNRFWALLSFLMSI
ncbi:LANO_0C02520g1_1 [Lachancea nothofagi CBS 11611]|uniref:LANO_0C02520g1_1 n=1 Tax=Lachancea nothofagi CBS 11611 TaxID=1266666 RepID=A0A1G4J4X1_9SACH|nr:LANO_0C02520g1_1 [Lachancea nothofagi CBS 11611]